MEDVMTTKTRLLTDEERQACRDADRERTRDAVQALRASDGWQQWLSLRRHFRTYSLTNQLLIAAAMPGATRVAGFRAWLKLGYCVRRGERAVIRIWMPIPPSQKHLEAWRAAGADPEEKPRTRYKLGPVWDRCQVEPLPAPAEPVALDPPITRAEGECLAWAQPRLAALVSELGCSLAYEPLEAAVGGWFAPATRRISINSQNAVDHQVRTLVHELAHALIHLTDRDGPELSYEQEELVVESIAVTVLGGLGVDMSGYSIPYLASWSENDEALEVIETCAGLIDRHAKRIEQAFDQADAAIVTDAVGSE
jgi:hypothetical protein